MLVSIIIPMRNEEAFVRRCLDSVLGQIPGRQDIEVLCIDGASTDRTRALVQEYVQRDPRVRLLDNPRRIVPCALNLALREARGEFIMRLDCHAEYAADYVDQTLAALARTGADIIGGYLNTVPHQDTPVGRAIAAATSTPFGVGGSAFRTGGAEQATDALPFGTFRRSVFSRFGLFDERLVRNQDIEFYGRVRRGGGKVMLSPQIRLTYVTRATYGGLRQQAFYNGLWNPYTLYLTGGGPRWRHFVPLAFVLSLLTLAVAGGFWWPAWALLVAELLLYVGVAGVAAARAAPPARTRARLVFLAFLQFHLAYGFGELCGLLTAPWKFGLRRHARPDSVPLQRAV